MNTENELKNFSGTIQETAKKKVVYTEHALNEMNAEEEIISNDEVKQVILEGEIIEDYPEDKRGHSCLKFAYSSKGRPVHIVCSPKDDYLGIITAYVPALEKWQDGFRTRRK